MAIKFEFFHRITIVITYQSLKQISYDNQNKPHLFP